MFVKKCIFALIIMFIGGASLHAESWDKSEITEYKAGENLFIVGDRAYSYYYITDEGVIVIDPMNSKIANAMMSFIKKRTNKPVKYVFYSHNHWDHISGGKVFKDQGATFIAHEEVAKNIAPGRDDVVMPDLTWTGHNTTFKFGGKTIELHTFMEKDHGEGNTQFYFPEYDGLLVADLVAPERVLFAYMPDAKPQNWLKHLYEIKKWKFTTLYMTHVRPVGTRADLDNQIAYYEDLYKLVDTTLKEGKVKPFDMATTLKMPQWEHLLFYKEWLGMNIWRIYMEKNFGQ
ncbi:MAG: MBL fold metallo-hydrolase [Campylobacteraceae bacterium]